MEIKNLKDTPLQDIVAAIGESFSDYFLPMPSDISYWEKRFKGARVDLELSFGMFVDGKLNGFIINGVDEVSGVKTAFNTGTGVTHDARGHGVTERLYQYAFPIFKEQGIDHCVLEVIEQNERARHVYDRIGFRINKRLKCFKGTITLPPDDSVQVTEVPFSAVEQKSRAADHHYSWDNTSTTIKASGDQYKTYEVSFKGNPVGFFIINPSSGYVAQLETAAEGKDKALQLLTGIARVADLVKVNNVAADRTDMIDALNEAGLDNFIDQYEMQMPVA